MIETANVDNASVADRWDRVYRALSHRVRRRLIVSLCEQPASAWVPLPDAASSVHSRGESSELVTSLHHRHLPVLADHDYVTWRTSPFEAARGANFEEVGAVVEAVFASSDELPETLIEGCEPLERRLRRGFDR